MSSKSPRRADWISSLPPRPSKSSTAPSSAAAAHPASTRRASSEDKGDQHFRGLLVLRIGTGEEPGHIALLHEGAVDEVPADQCHGDQPADAANQPTQKMTQPTPITMSTTRTEV